MSRNVLTLLAVAAIGLAACSSDGDSSSSTLDPATVDALEQGVEDGPLVSPDDLAPGPQLDPVGSDLLVEPTTEPPATDDDSAAAESGGVESGGVEPEGFTTVLVEITEPDGEVCEVCLWLADSAVERGQGLMGVTSLGEPEGMAFVWEQPTAGAFFMFQTVTPLSIAWFAEPVEPDAGGALVSTADMDPCLSENSADCERFPAGGEFVLAIEVFQGDLASIGITDGASARLLPDTEAFDCPLR